MSRPSTTPGNASARKLVARQPASPAPHNAAAHSASTDKVPGQSRQYRLRTNIVLKVSTLQASSAR